MVVGSPPGHAGRAWSPPLSETARPSARIRNLRRPGVASIAVSAVDVALWECEIAFGPGVPGLGVGS